MKILQINSTYGQGAGGGTEQSIPNLCRLLEERGHSNVVLYSNGFPPLLEAPSRRLFHLEKVCDNVDLKPAENQRLVGQVVAMAEQEGIEVVHFHQINNTLLVQELTHRFPSVYFVHNHILTCPSGQRLYKTNWQECTLDPGLACLVNPYLKNCGTRRPVGLVRRYFNCLDIRKEARLFNELMVDSEFMKFTLVRSGFMSDQISVVPTVTELPTLTPIELTYPTEMPPQILYVGQLTEIKGLEFVLRALPQMQQAAHLVVVGEGYQRATLEKLAASLGVAERVTFAGWRLKTELGPYYQAARVVVVPSIYPEPFGLVGAEAMSYARPVVGFRRGGIPEWLRDGETGLLAEPGQSPELAAHLDQLLANPELAERMGRAGRMRLEQDFNPATICSAFLEAYARAIARYNTKSG